MPPKKPTSSDPTPAAKSKTPPKPAAAAPPKDSPAPPVKAPTPAKAKPTEITHDQIARRAFEIYAGRGFTPGDPNWDWAEAERQLRAGK